MKDKLEQIKEALGATTQGHWEAREGLMIDDMGLYVVHDKLNCQECKSLAEGNPPNTGGWGYRDSHCGGWVEATEEDYEFISAAHNDYIPWLIAQLEESFYT